MTRHMTLPSGLKLESVIVILLKLMELSRQQFEDDI